MAARTKYRKRALDILFECEIRGLPPGETLAGRVAGGHPPISEFTVQLVEGVAAHHAELDEAIASRLQGWTLDRMPAVDRNILRLGVYEVLYGDAPDEVAISEAVALARELSTDESPGFVNGVLATVVREQHPAG